MAERAEECREDAGAVGGTTVGAVSGKMAVAAGSKMAEVAKPQGMPVAGCTLAMLALDV